MAPLLFSTFRSTLVMLCSLFPDASFSSFLNQKPSTVRKLNFLQRRRVSKKERRHTPTVTATYRLPRHNPFIHHLAPDALLNGISRIIFLFTNKTSIFQEQKQLFAPTSTPSCGPLYSKPSTFHTTGFLIFVIRALESHYIFPSLNRQQLLWQSP